MIKHQDHLIPLLKGLSWRFFGSISTAAIAYIVSGEIKVALSIGALEVLTKVALFYVHERFWDRLKRNLLTGVQAS